MKTSSHLRGEAEIAGEILALDTLAPKLLPRSLFGVANRKKVAIQLEVLRDRVGEMELSMLYDLGDDAEAELHASALVALRWMTSEDEDERPSPSEWWKEEVA